METIHGVAVREALDLYDPTSRDKALAEAIDFELLAAEAEAGGYFDDPEIARLVKKMAVGKLLRDRLDTPAASTPAPTDQELRAYYKTHPADFSQPAVLKAQMLRVAAEKAEAVQAAITAAEKPFGNLVAEHSTDPSARANGGMSNWIIENQSNKRYPAQLVSALFAVDAGQIVGPIPSPQGVWFAKLTEKRPARATPFEEARSRIAQEISRTQRQKAYEALVESLRSTAEIQQYPERLEASLESNIQASGPPPGPPGR